MTGWILEPCYPPSQTPRFQCLLLEDGETPEWCEGDVPTSPGGSWTPNTGQSPAWHDGSVSSSWRILEADAPRKYYLSPAQCAHFLKLAQIAGFPPPPEIEALFLIQGGAYPSSDPFNAIGSSSYQKAKGVTVPASRVGKGSVGSPKLFRNAVCCPPFAAPRIRNP